jgi:hypothetical protein
MLPKSNHRAYVRYDDGAKAVKYYNAATRKVLTSRNYRHLTPPDPTPPEEIEIEVTPNQPCKGESGESTPLMGVTGVEDPTCNLGPRKQKQKHVNIVDDVDVDEPRRTHGIRTDYCHLSDPYSDEKDVDNTLLSIEEVYAIIAGDELTSLKDAKNSPEWPEWERAMQEELDLLKKMGTWELVPKPPDAVPIKNKWVFIKK